jgi:hypothetical protein
MKKFLFWSGLGAVIITIFACIFHVYFQSDPNSRRATLEVWLTGFGAIGSFGAVVIALYSEPIKKFFLRPELNVRVLNTPPFCIIEKVDAGALEKDEFVDICCMVENIGGATAEKCQIVCEEILTLGADKKYSVSEENRFRRLFFTWIGIGDKPIESDIAVADHGYFKLAEIRTKNSELGKASVGGVPSEFSQPFLVVCLPSRTVKSQFIQFEDDKSIIIHFKIACVGLLAKERYVQIAWEGKSIADFKSHPEKLAITDVTSRISELRKATF